MVTKKIIINIFDISKSVIFIPVNDEQQLIMKSHQGLFNYLILKWKLYGNSVSYENL